MSRLAALLVALGLILPRGPAPAQTPPVDTARLAAGSAARMHMLYERTIFQVNVLTLDVRFGSRTAARIDSFAEGRSYGKAVADSVAALALGAREAWARVRFKRGVSLSRFLGGIRDNLRQARKAGIVSQEEFDLISSGLPRWYEFLRGRGIREGDEMIYRISGDSLRTVFRNEGGEVLLDQWNVGPERRLAVLGGYFAPGSAFRKGLVRSLFRDSGGGV